METSPFTLFIHPECIEGAQLVIRRDQFLIKEGFSSAFIQTTEAQEVSVFEKINNFLKFHQWQDHHISFIIPTEEVTFRTITFPFQNKKKIQKALPFEIENEVIEDVDSISYQYILKTLSDGTTKVLLASIHKTYLESLQSVTNQNNLSIRNIDCSAYALYKSLPHSSSTTLQVYLGAEETFINVIEDNHLQIVKTFPNRIPIYLKGFENLSQIEIKDLPLLVQNHEDISKKYPHLDQQEFQSLALEIKGEVKWLRGQFNLFSRSWQLDKAIHVSLYGLFHNLIKWDGESFEWSEYGFSSDEETLSLQPEYEEGDYLEKVDSTLDNPSQELQTLLDQETLDLEDEQPLLESTYAETALNSTSTYWGILEELKKHSLNHLRSHELSFYSEDTTWKSFFGKHRLMVFIGVFFLLLSLGGVGLNYYLQIQLLKKEIKITERQIQNLFKRLLPRASSENIPDAITLLKNNIQEKRDLSKDIRFNKRSYSNLSLMKKISQLLPNASLKIERLEFNKTRFVLKGSINNYANLQILKNSIEQFDEFKGQKATESNRSIRNGINFNISMNR